MYTADDLHKLPLLDYLDALGYSYRMKGTDVYGDVEDPTGHIMSSFVYNKKKNVWTYNAGGISGYGAWDYVRKIEGLTMPGEIQARLEEVMAVDDAERAAQIETRVKEREEKSALVQQRPDDDGKFHLPPQSPTINQLRTGLCGKRCIDREVLEFFVDQGLIYESNEPWVRADGQTVYFHNAIFVARDEFGEARAAEYKYLIPKVDEETGREFYPRGTVSHSDHKHYLPSYFSGKSSLLVIFESVIDALSYITMQKMKGRAWDAYSFISLEGACAKYTVVPQALRTLLDQHKTISDIVLALDNDKTGLAAMDSLGELLTTHYNVIKYAPPAEKRQFTHGKDEFCKDWSDLCIERVKALKTAEFMAQVEESDPAISKS